MKNIFILTLLLLTLTLFGCAGIGQLQQPQKAGTDVFSVIEHIALQEGVDEVGGKCAYRQSEKSLFFAGILNAEFNAVFIGKYSDPNTCIIVYDRVKQQYWTTLIVGDKVVDKHLIERGKAEEEAEKMLKDFLSGRKTTLEQFLRRIVV